MDSKIEIARSFSMKLNTGNYTSADFFCSAKKEVNQEEAEKTSETLYFFCRSEVVKSINIFKKEPKENLSVYTKGKSSESKSKIEKKDERVLETELDALQEITN